MNWKDLLPPTVLAEPGIVRISARTKADAIAHVRRIFESSSRPPKKLNPLLAVVGNPSTDVEIQALQRYVATHPGDGRTATELIAAVLQAAGKKAVACGNLGQPLCEVAPLSGGLDYAVAEVSSFQLETIETFRPRRLMKEFLRRNPEPADKEADQ